MKKYASIYLLFFLAVFMTSAVEVRAEDGSILVWNSDVSRLLAAGLYGVREDEPHHWSVRLKNDKDIYKGFVADSAGFAGQGITLSYEGSSGLLGFSAGYIYTSGGDERERNFASVFLGSYDPPSFTADDVTGAWYLALDFSSPFYSPRDNISLGVGGEVMLINDPHALENEERVALSLNFPISYKNRITITPEAQWGGSMSNLRQLLSDEEHEGEAVNDDVFYGGVSISFSY
jgi:hypothetical protein